MKKKLLNDIKETFNVNYNIKLKTEESNININEKYFKVLYNLIYFIIFLYLILCHIMNYLD
jgi:hypothetical protein